MMENIFFELGNDAFDSEDYEKAIIHYNKALDLEPANQDLLYNLSISLFENNDYQTSIEISNKLIISGETSFFELSLFNRGNCYQKLKEYKNAINDFSTIIKLHPDDSNAYFNRSNAREKLGDAKGTENDRKTVKYFERKNITHDLYISPQPTEIENYDLDKFTNDKSKLLDEISITPNSYSLYFELGNTYAKIREFQKAIENFTKAIELYPEEFYEDANQNLIAAYNDIADYQKVIVLADEFIKQNPESDIVKEMRIWALEELNKTA